MSHDQTTGTLDALDTNDHCEPSRLVRRRSHGRRGVLLAAAIAIVGLGAGCSSSSPTATAPTTAAAASAPASSSTSPTAAGDTPTTTAAGGDADGTEAFCTRLANGANELSQRLKAGAKVTDPSYQEFTKTTNDTVLAAAPSDLKADLTVVYATAEAVRQAAGAGDPKQAVAASNTPEFKKASANYLAWVKKNCSAAQVQQITGGR